MVAGSFFFFFLLFLHFCYLIARIYLFINASFSFPKLSEVFFCTETHSVFSCRCLCGQQTTDLRAFPTLAFCSQQTTDLRAVPSLAICSQHTRAIQKCGQTRATTHYTHSVGSLFFSFNADILRITLRVIKGCHGRNDPHQMLRRLPIGSQLKPILPCFISSLMD